MTAGRSWSSPCSTVCSPPWHRVYAEDAPLAPLPAMTRWLRAALSTDFCRGHLQERTPRESRPGAAGGRQPGAFRGRNVLVERARVGLRDLSAMSPERSRCHDRGPTRPAATSRMDLGVKSMGRKS